MDDKDKKIVTELLDAGVTQLELGEYLNLTRQSVGRLKEGYELTSAKTSKLDYLRNKSADDAKKLIKISKFFREIEKKLSTCTSETLDQAFEAFQYIHYWGTDEKFQNNVDKFFSFLMGHIVNFLPRFNQHVLLVKDFFNRERFPVVTVQLDYKKKTVSDFCIKAMKSKYDRMEYDTTSIYFPVSLQDFVVFLKKMLGESPRFNIYLDYVDDEWSFIEENLLKSLADEFKNMDSFDFSRLFNFFKHNYKIGPLLEDVLEQFKIEFDEKKLLNDCRYRAEKIVDLIEMTALDALIEKQGSPDKIFDGYSRKSEHKYVQTKRRIVKEGMYEKKD